MSLVTLRQMPFVRTGVHAMEPSISINNHPHSPTVLVTNLLVGKFSFYYLTAISLLKGLPSPQVHDVDIALQTPVHLITPDIVVMNAGPRGSLNVWTRARGLVEHLNHDGGVIEAVASIKKELTRVSYLATLARVDSQLKLRIWESTTTSYSPHSVPGNGEMERTFDWKSLISWFSPSNIRPSERLTALQCQCSFKIVALLISEVLLYVILLLIIYLVAMWPVGLVTSCLQLHIVQALDYLSRQFNAFGHRHYENVL
ncbi:hypothetical protein SISNIDRAFT_471773 [Sistotremastrum niveocremeum HHB9708]|uniref:Uncharacterized protein n=1 Tax=Sistotremastrum niveocremeum HHB9708 TaxID=1314777 RepID=A0A164M8C6_9AGAM|nr:hypothetical protein SISNIDRAFT_471773 [Sistotremastrum niveocremeum HHB9708]